MTPGAIPKAASLAHCVCVMHFQQHVELSLEVADGDSPSVFENLDSNNGAVPPGFMDHAKLTLACMCDHHQEGLDVKSPQ